MELSPDRILQTGLAFWASKTLLSAVEIGLFTELAKQPGDLESLRDRLGLHPRSARDFLDALVALGFLERVDGVYRNTAETGLFLDKAKPSYIGGILEMANSRLYPYWGDLTTALWSGEPQNESKGGLDPFAALYADPLKLREFLRAMSGVSRGANLAIAAKFPWERYHSCADIGTAQGVQGVDRGVDDPGPVGREVLQFVDVGGVPDVRAARRLGPTRLGGHRPLRASWAASVAGWTRSGNILRE